MADRVVPGPVSADDCIKEAVCIDTAKIMDSCKDKDCIEDLRVYPTMSSLDSVLGAFSVRPKAAELIHSTVKVEGIALNRGYYTVDVTYYYRVLGEAFPSGQSVAGLAVFDKRLMLYGSEGRVKSYSSSELVRNELPYAVLDAVDPIALHMSVSEAVITEPDPCQREIPAEVAAAFDSDISFSATTRNWLVTLGQFSIVRLLRTTQLLIPAYDYCLPEKECVGSVEDDPCTMFGRIRFPVDEFFPPERASDFEDCANPL